MENDVFYQDLKSVYLVADFEFRTGRINERELGEVHLDVFTKMLSQYEALQPYISDFEKEAQKKWEQSLTAHKILKAVKEQKLTSTEERLIQDLKNKFLLADLAFKKRQLPTQLFLKTMNEVMIKLFDRTNQIQPYLNQFLEAADLQWQEKK